MVSLEQRLYLPSISNNMCEEISLTPFTHIFISTGFTIFFFIIVPAIFAGNGPVATVVSFVTLAWYLLCFIVDVYRDYMFYDRRPNYDVFARCLLNKEYNERLFFKILVIGVLSQRVVASLMRCDVGATGIKAFRIFMKLFYAFAAPALVGRAVAGAGASIGMGWPFIYLFIVGGLFSGNAVKVQLAPGMLWISAAETMLTGSDEEQDVARIVMTAAEGALVAIGADVPSPNEDFDEDKASPAMIIAHDPTNENGEAKEGASPVPAAAPVASPKVVPSCVKHAKLNYFAELADRESIPFKILVVIGAAVSAYICVVSWDWSYGQNDISYASAWSVLDVYRPTAVALYDKRYDLTASQAAYIASLFC